MRKVLAVLARSTIMHADLISLLRVTIMYADLISLLRVISTYRIISTKELHVIPHVLPTDLQIKRFMNLYQISAYERGVIFLISTPDYLQNGITDGKTQE